MASAGAAVWCLLLSFTAVTTEVNTTNHIFNTTTFSDHSVTYDVTDNYATQSTESTTTTPSDTNTEPLPVSGRLLTPVTEGNLSLDTVVRKQTVNLYLCFKPILDNVTYQYLSLKILSHPGEAV